MDIKEIARKLWIETAEIVPQCDHHLHFAEALVAEIRRRGEPVAEYKTYTGNGDFCAPFNQVVFNSGYVPEVGTKFFTFPPSTEALEDKVAEACAAMANYFEQKADDLNDSISNDDDHNEGRSEYIMGKASASSRIAKAIRSGEWKKFRKE